MKLLFSLILNLIVVKYILCAGGTCRLTNDHKNFTCNGFPLSPFSVSRNSRPQIIRLWIYNCQTVTIEEEAIQFPNVESLTLACDVKTFHENAFRNLNHLQQLNLSYNAISAIPDHLFQSTGELQTLNLSRNNLEELTRGAFDGLNNLNELSVSYNSISKLHYKTLSPLKKLEKLYMNYNRINTIPNALFNQLKNLKYIDLSHNDIKNVNNIFEPTYGLTSLNLSHNVLTDLASKLFQTTKLEVLDLSYNRLNIVYEDSLKLDTLQELFLQDNKITLFEVKAQGLIQFPLNWLDLRNNRLVFLEDHFIKAAANLMTLKVDGNPWDCKCYEHMETLRGEVGLDIGVEYHLGELPLCVLGNFVKCEIDKNNLTYYYELYQEQFDPRR